MARHNRRRADLVEAIAQGYGGVQSKDAVRQMQAFIDALRSA